MDYILDVQGFKRSLNRFVWKEVAIVAIEKDAVPLVFHFEPPYRWAALQEENQSCNRWLAKNHHGLAWESGDIPYEKLQDTLEAALKNACRIFVKGLEKKNWVKEMLPRK